MVRAQISFATASIVLTLGASTSVAQRAAFPVEAGEAVATCNANPDSRFVAGVLDIRDPGCDPLAVLGQHWPARMYHNELPNPTSRASDEWSEANLGPVFGIAIDQRVPPNIYLTPTTVYNISAVASGKVWRLHGSTGAISVLATLPSSTPSPGLGNIAYDPDHRQLFVTNHEDGRIYRISVSGAVLDFLDPFAPDDGSPGFAPLGERLWGVGVYESRVYFAVWAEDLGRVNPTAANAIWSAGLVAGSGAFSPGDVTLEFEIEPVSGGTSGPVSDITFLPARERMVIAERTMTADTGSGAHQGRGLEFRGGHLSWRMTSVGFGLGSSLKLSAGGVAYDCGAPDACNRGRNLWMSADALRLGVDAVYGIAGFPETGGEVEDAYLIDLDDEITQQDKTGIGDVEVYHPECTVLADAGPDLVLCGVPGDILLDGSGTLVTGCTSPPIYRWRSGTTVVRDWSTDPTVTVRPTTTIGYQLDVRCSDCPGSCSDASANIVQILPDAIPAGLGNTLRAVKSGLDVVMTWGSALDASTYRLYRGDRKETWPPLPHRSLITGPLETLVGDVGGLSLYYYRVAGASCSGKEGP